MRPASFFLLAATFAAGSVNAQTIVPNLEDGRIKAYTCTGCHGIEGWRNSYPSFRVPRIKGQHYEYLVQALTDYRAGTRRHTTMQAQGEAMSDQDIADIAAYLAGGAPSATAAATPVEARPADAGNANPPSE